MHVMRNLGKWKMPISRIFGIFASVGSFLGLVQPICAFCTFYHILLFYLSHAYRCFLCYALLHRFVCNLFYSSKHLCACFITFHAAFYDLQFAAVVVHLFLCGHYFARFYQIVSMDVPTYMMLTAYNANYKDLWHYPAKPDRAIGLWIVSVRRFVRV